MTEVGGQPVPVRDHAPLYQWIWVLRVCYEDEEAWSSPEAAFPRALDAARAVSAHPVHAEQATHPPVLWQSVDPAHDWADDAGPCPGIDRCTQCLEWRGVVDGDDWYRIDSVPFYPHAMDPRWEYVSGCPDTLSDAPRARVSAGPPVFDQ